MGPLPAPFFEVHPSYMMRSMQKLTGTLRSRELFRRKVIKYFEENKLINSDFSRNLLENFRVFDALDFIALVTSHIPPKHKQYMRRYGCLCTQRNTPPAVVENGRNMNIYTGLLRMAGRKKRK